MPLRSSIVSEAARWEGTPYQHQTSRCGVGADCLGFVRGVYRAVIGPEPYHVPPYRAFPSRGQGELLLDAAQAVLTPCDQMKPASVLFFRFSPHFVAHHAAIVLSPQILIQALHRRGVCRIGFHPWWRRRLVAAFDFPDIRDD